ncbi:hypothetical protein [Streptomyces sp. NBC_00096]|uniref:hypothetical protein n=1 Tax=Streptomyces sp. NBC_00096 TaxID=2975650 RepID=UPI00324562A4
MELEYANKVKTYALANIDDARVKNLLDSLLGVLYPKQAGDDVNVMLDVNDLRLNSYVTAIMQDGLFRNDIIEAVDGVNLRAFADQLENFLLPQFVVCNKKYYGIVQPGYASGDQFGIGYVLATDPHSSVFLTQKEATSESGASSAAYYKSLGVPANRIRMGLTNKQAEGEIRKVTGEGKNAKLRGNSGIREVNEGTKQVSKTFSPAKKAKHREALGLSGDAGAAHLKDPQVKEWLASKGVPDSGKIVILWSRFSGKSGNAHTEHDTSYTGMAQIIAGLKDMDAVLIVGDSQPKGKAGGQEKYQHIADTFNNYGGKESGKLWGKGEGKMVGRGMRKKWVSTEAGDELNDNFGAKVIVMTEFWKDETAKSWGGNGRTGQFLLYDYLHRNYDVARHLGFRSGNLEAIAMLGFDVRYMEEPDSWGGDRMAVWHARPDGKTTGGGDAAGYERLGVTDSSNRLGRHLLEQPGSGFRSNQLESYKTPEQRKAARFKEDGTSRPRGFTDHDLQNVDQYLVNGDPLHGIPDAYRTTVKGIADELNVAKKRFLLES